MTIDLQRFNLGVHSRSMLTASDVLRMERVRLHRCSLSVSASLGQEEGGEEGG